MDDKPKEYQRGWVEFYKLKFAVNENVLIPRPETELLVDRVLDYVKKHPSQPLTILDIGTGAGAIIVSVAVNLAKQVQSKQLTLIATDISPEALEMAKKNAQLHGVSDISFFHSDLLSNDQIKKLTPDIIVTNLPYIPSARIAYLDSSVKDYEPHVALDGGEDGFELYRKLFQQMKNLHWLPKLLVGEIDYTQDKIAIEQAQRFFPQLTAQMQLDLFHRQRLLVLSDNADHPSKDVA